MHRSHAPSSFRSPSTRLAVLAACVGAAWPAAAQPAGSPLAQPPTQPTPQPIPLPAAPDPAQPTTPTVPTAPPSLDELPPVVRIGFRAEALRQKQEVIPTVVIVPDAGSYLQAIRAWTPLRRFPVLIDDGTPLMHEHIARFVRGFKPERVVRWSAPEPVALDTAAQRQAALEDLVRSVWQYGTATSPTLDDAVRAVALTESPGVVVAGPSDPAWTAAAALAAGRGQHVIWVEAAQGVSDAFTRDQSEAFCRDIEAGIAALGFPWTILGDSIDSVAVCMNTPVRALTLQDGQWLATTDRLGHASDDPRDAGRWGWASQVHGSEAEAAYRAMSALFIPVDSGWFYDGYGRGQPWETYALRFAKDTLAPGIPSITLIEHPRNGLAAWRAAVVNPIDAALVMVNTHGMRNFFELPDGAAWCGEVPVLSRPAVVSFIHSWSAYQPGDRNCISGRWFERGAYAYCGSVQEPYLVAFQKPVALASRLAALVPWAVACRVDATPSWKIAMFGDPLITLGAAQARSTEPLPLDAVEAVDDEMRAALRAGDIAATVRALSLLGRDADLARLVSRLRAEDSERLTGDVAQAALHGLFRQGQQDDLQAMYRLLDERAASDPMNRDLLWLSCRSDLPNGVSVVGLLKPHIREEQRTSDTADLALMAFAAGQRDAAITLLTEYRRTLTDEAQIRHIDTAMRMVRGL